MKIHTKNSESAIVVVATLRQGGQAELKILDGPGQRISFGTGYSRVVVQNAEPFGPGSEINARVIAASSVKLDWSDKRPVNVPGKEIIPMQALNDGVLVSMLNPRTKYEKISAMRFGRVYELK